jgi:hypothetical protein
MRIPRRVVHGALSAAKFAGNPAQVRLRRALARDPDVSRNAALTVDPNKGYATFSAGVLPGLEPVLGRCRDLFEARRQELSRQAFLLNPNKLFLLSVLAGDDFCAHPDLLRFMVSRPILDIATAYLGAVPLLAGANLWWSPPNDSASSSQLFHTDNEDWRQLKVMINVYDTDASHGPFTLVPADASERALRATRYVTGRLPDEAVHAHIGDCQPVAFTGRAGSGGFVDTSRCLHFGSRENRDDRLVLAFQFLRFESPTESTSVLRVPPGLRGLDADPIQLLALGLE